MNRIVATVTSLAQHRSLLVRDPELYRPPACPHCGLGKLWRHGCYQRKVELGVGSNAVREPVPIPRFRCPGCQRTCSRLPACIAPRRWYDWLVQQAVLLLLLGGGSVRECARCTGRARSTVRRWRDWLHERGECFAFFLRSRLPELGRWAEFESFWRNVIDGLSLQQAMVLLDRDLIVP